MARDRPLSSCCCHPGFHVKILKTRVEAHAQLQPLLSIEPLAPTPETVQHFVTCSHAEELCSFLFSAADQWLSDFHTASISQD